jgi:hypothetical protein
LTAPDVLNDNAPPLPLVARTLENKQLLMVCPLQAEPAKRDRTARMTPTNMKGKGGLNFESIRCCGQRLEAIQFVDENFE